MLSAVEDSQNRAAKTREKFIDVEPKAQAKSKQIKQLKNSNRLSFLELTAYFPYLH